MLTLDRHSFFDRTSRRFSAEAMTTKCLTIMGDHLEEKNSYTRQLVDILFIPKSNTTKNVKSNCSKPSIEILSESTIQRLRLVLYISLITICSNYDLRLIENWHIRLCFKRSFTIIIVTLSMNSSRVPSIHAVAPCP